MPDVMAQSGAVLREVRTTNRTLVKRLRCGDRRPAALILRVHPSNFKVVGFTERPALEERVALGRRFKVRWPKISAAAGSDGPSTTLGTGRCAKNCPEALRDEPIVSESVAAGRVDGSGYESHKDH